MKRLLLTFLAIFYLGVSQGATVYFHYCMGELVEMGLSSKEQKTCNFCGMNQSDNAKDSCCKDEASQAKVDHSQKTAPVSYDFQQAATLVKQHLMVPATQPTVPFELGKSALSNAPPKVHHIPVFIRNCSYII